METLLVQGNSKADIKIFENLAKRLGLKSKFIDLEAVEDIALANAMETGRTGQYVDTNDFLANLKQKNTISS